MKIRLFLFLSVLFSSLIFGQNTEVTFEVNMSNRIDQGLFNPTTNFIDIAGNFNNWNGQNHRLSDEDGNEIYELTIDGFTSGTTIEFKFRIDGDWNGKEEFPNGGPNRKYIVQDDNNVVSVWYNDEIPPGEGFNLAFNADHSEVFTGSIVRYYNQSVGEFDQSSWFFEGGEPTTSTDSEPLVKYDQTGNFDVRLIVSDGTTTDTITKTHFIEVSQRDIQEIDWWNDAVFYEIFVRSFKDSNGDGIGDFNGLTESLDYLNDGDPTTNDDLGITGIWLMPIHPSPSYHGYDVTDYQDIHPDYGSMEDFKNFLDAAHERGIKVIIDFVMNHSSVEHPWFTNSASSTQSDKRNWYRWEGFKPSQSGPWGQEVWHQNNSDYYYGLFWGGMPDLNYNEPEVTEEMFTTADFWLNDIGIDGFRLDAVKYIVENGNQLEDANATFQFWKDYQAEIKKLKSDALSVGEAWTSTDKVLNYVQDGRLDICFDFDMANSILAGVNTEVATGIVTQAQNIYNVYPNNQFGTFLTNHDMNRAIEVLNNDAEKMKTAAAISLTLPGTPFIYYGEEVLMRGTKPDEFIRRPMQWSSAMNAGFTTGNPWIQLNSNYATANVSELRATPTSILNLYDQLIEIRNSEIALRRGNFTTIPSSDNRILSFQRVYQGESIVVQINLSNATVAFESDLSFTNFISGNQSLTDLITSEDMTWSVNTDQQVSALSIGPRQIRILKSTFATSVLKEEVDIRRMNITPVPAETTIHISIESNQEDIRYFIYDLKGQIRQSGHVTNKGEISINGLPKGNYVLQAKTKDGFFSGKFVKL